MLKALRAREAASGCCCPRPINRRSAGGASPAPAPLHGRLPRRAFRNVARAVLQRPHPVLFANHRATCRATSRPCPHASDRACSPAMRPRRQRREGVAAQAARVQESRSSRECPTLPRWPKDAPTGTQHPAFTVPEPLPQSLREIEPIDDDRGLTFPRSGALSLVQKAQPCLSSKGGPSALVRFGAALGAGWHTAK